MIGCGIRFLNNLSNDKNESVIVYFTRNNVLIGEKPIRIPNGGFFLTIGMQSMGAKVILNPF